MTIHIDKQKNPIRIIVDGPNYGGKSTITNIIKDIYSGITIIEYHDFLHKHVLRQENFSIDLSLKQHWTNLNDSSKVNSLNYLISRENLAFKIFRVCDKDDILIERLFLTRYVYCELLFGKDSLQKIENDKKQISLHNVKLIYVTAPPDILIKRSLINNSKRDLRMEKESPYHLLNKEAIIKKYDLYEKYFKCLGNISKLRLDSSYGTHDNKFIDDLIKFLQI